MTLLITALAAVVSTVIWYTRNDDRMQLGFLSLMFWGASLMWLVDAVFEFIELKAEYFTPVAEDMFNDLFLGLSVVALGLVIWLAVLLIKDPKGIVKATILKKN